MVSCVYEHLICDIYFDKKTCTSNSYDTYL